MNGILIGFEKDSGDPVRIGITHTVFAGITRAGKSETVKAAVSRSEKVRFLILDVKKPRDYAELGQDIPIYIEEKTEPLMLKRLLESQSHLALKFEFPELLKVCKKATTYPEILQAVNEGLEAKKHPIVKDKLLVLQHLLSRLVRELKQTEISDRLELKNRINIMDLSQVSKEMQQLAVHSTLKKLLEEHENVVVIADEFHRFAPQYGSNASKETVTTYIKEGGAKGLWLWVIDQTITGVDKQVLKQCWVWILGKQREVNEAKRTLDQIPFKTGLTDKAVMRLKVGHFIVCTEDFAKVTYVLLPDVPEQMAGQVARGELPVSAVREYLEDVRAREDEEDLKWKEKCEEECRVRKTLEKTLGEYSDQVKTLQEKIRDLEKKLEEKKSPEELQKAQKHIKLLESKVEALKGLVEEHKEDLQLFDELRSVLRRMNPHPAAPHQGPSEMLVVNEQPALTVQRIRKPLELSQESLEGRIAIVYAEGLLPREKAFSLGQLNQIMTERYGRKEAYANFKPVLQKFVAWGFLEKVKAGSRWDYRVKMAPDVAREKGLLKITEEKFNG